MAALLDALGIFLSVLGIVIATVSDDMGWAVLFTVLGVLSVALTLGNYRKYCRRAKETI